MPENLIPSYELINSKTTLSSLLSPASGRQTKPSTAYTCMVPHACPLWLKHLSLCLALCLTLHPPLHLPSQWKAEKMDVFHFSRHRCVPAAKVKFEPRFHGSQTHKVFLEKKKRFIKVDKSCVREWNCIFINSSRLPFQSPSYFLRNLLLWFSIFVLLLQEADKISALLGPLKRKGTI